MPPPRYILGFDFGMRRIGVAVGQTLLGTATPIKILTCRAGAPDWPGISQLIREWQPTLLVVGLPISADGTETLISSAARAFVDALAQRYSLPVDTIDERLSSHAASQILSSRAQRHRPDAYDHIAAQIILETWLAEQSP